MPPSLAKTIEALDLATLSQMNAQELLNVILMLKFDAMTELKKRKLSAELGAIKRRYKYKK